jgi:flavin reductase (DIM6/NTAB) family NADH-FMN oxidoreductase RutF
MEISDIGIFGHIRETLARLNDPGALLVAGKPQPNVMTIGWGTLGIIWGMPIFIVYVRPSRFTHHLLEEHAEFSVNIPAADMAEEVAICGTKSGRDTDKFVECNFTLQPGIKIEVPHIAQCPIHYECRIVHKNAVQPDALKRGIRADYYASGDWHDVYYGEILGVYRSTQ